MVLFVWVFFTQFLKCIFKHIYSDLYKLNTLYKRAVTFQEHSLISCSLSLYLILCRKDFLCWLLLTVHTWSNSKCFPKYYSLWGRITITHQQRCLMTFHGMENNFRNMRQMEFIKIRMHTPSILRLVRPQIKGCWQPKGRLHGYRSHYRPQENQTPESKSPHFYDHLWFTFIIWPHKSLKSF